MPPSAPPRTKAFGTHHRKSTILSFSFDVNQEIDNPESIVFDINQEISVREARHAKVLVEEYGVQRDARYAVEQSAGQNVFQREGEGDEPVEGKPTLPNQKGGSGTQ